MAGVRCSTGKPGLLVLGQGVGAAAEPVSDVPDGRRGLAKRCFLRAGPVEVVADEGVAAAVAQRLDLVEQAREAAVALAGVLVEVRLKRVELAVARPFQRPSASSCQVATRA
jgi:hypothetical protein